VLRAPGRIRTSACERFSAKPAMLPFVPAMPAWL
jgi:hypothetical protein